MHAHNHAHASLRHISMCACMQASMYVHTCTYAQTHTYARTHTHKNTQHDYNSDNKCKQHTYAQWKKAVHQCHTTMNIVQYIPI